MDKAAVVCYRNGVVHSIAAAARIANLSPDLIRSWERRYKIVQPERDASGVRLYSDADVARLTLASEATRLGHPIRIVAALDNEQLKELTARRPAGVGDANIVPRLLHALQVNDPSTASQMLRNAALMMPVRDLVFEVLAPALREAGRQWERGEMAIWQEHFLSNQITTVAGSLQHNLSGRTRAIFATPPFERHGFGIALAALLAAARGVDGCNLGVTVPAAELAASARKLQASVVVVGMTLQSVPQNEALAYARELDEDLPHGVDLIFGGVSGAQVAARLRSSRARGIATLEEFDTLCRQWA